MNMYEVTDELIKSLEKEAGSEIFNAGNADDAADTAKKMNAFINLLRSYACAIDRMDENIMQIAKKLR